MKKIFKTIFASLLVIFVLPYTAHADMGPKPSVTIDFNGINDRTFYVTLLSESSGYGPWNVHDDEYPEDYYLYGLSEEGKDAFWKMVDYKDSDGYYFLQNISKCDSENPSFAWTYFPPDPFKVLVYFPETDTFLVSDVTNRTVFHAKYTVALNEAKDGHIQAVFKSDTKGEGVAFAGRLVGTLIVELLIALVFAYKEKKIFGFIVKLNIVTQLLLNLVLSFTVYYGGLFVFILIYLFAEIMVFLIEAIAYRIYFPKHSQKNIGLLGAVLYAAIANAASFFAGIWIQVFFESVRF